MLIGFKQNNSIEKTNDTPVIQVNVPSCFTEEDAQLMIDKIRELRESKNSPVAEKISNHFRNIRNISLDSKVDDFIDWYFENMVKGYYAENRLEKFINNSLLITDQEVSYKYEVDEHCLIYLNGEKLNIGQKILTEEEIRRSERQLYDNLKSYREEHERNMRSSLEFAKSYYVK